MLRRWREPFHQWFCVSVRRLRTLDVHCRGQRIPDLSERLWSHIRRFRALFGKKRRRVGTGMQFEASLPVDDLGVHGLIEDLELVRCRTGTEFPVAPVPVSVTQGGDPRCLDGRIVGVER